MKAHYFIFSYLKVCADRDNNSELVRASSISNLATICKMLHWGLHSYVQQIMDNVVSLLMTEKSVEVRRAIIVVFTKLLEGLGMDVFQVIPHHLKTIYRYLKIIQEKDEDEV